MEPDTTFFDDPAIVFPVTVDPAVSLSPGFDAFVRTGDSSDQSGAGELMLGTFNAGGTKARSFLQFGGTDFLHGTSVLSAELRLLNHWSFSCRHAAWQAWRVGEVDASARWSSQPAWIERVGESTDTLGYDPCDPDGWVDVDVRDAFQHRADVGSGTTVNIGLRAGNENNSDSWKRFRSSEAASGRPHVLLTYAITAVPTGLSVDGIGCLAPVGGRMVGAAPVLSGVPQDSTGTVRALVEVRASGGSAPLRSWASGSLPAGEPMPWQVNPPLSNGGYEWRMRSENPGSGVTSEWTGWCPFTVDALLDAEPDSEPAAVECPVPAGEPLAAVDESVALLLAQACDAPAEVSSERDFDARVLAQPSGTLVAEQFARPQWARDETGEWVGVDPSLEVAADGSISTVAAVSEVEVSPGGSGPLLTATDPDGGAVSLTWPEPLPVPVVEGDTATYSEVLDDVDLKVTAGVDGFSYVLVVKSAAAAASSELASVTVDVDTSMGLQVVEDTTGGVVVQDAAGEAVFSAPAAYMWDSSEPDEPEQPGGFGVAAEEGSGEPEDVPPGLFTEMPLELVGGELTVEPDQELLNNPDVEFPVYVDPPFSGRRMHWASVHEQQPSRGWTDDSRWPRVGAGGKPEMRVGSLQWWPGFPCGDGCGLWRSAIRFDIRGLSGRQVVSASVKATQTHTSGCGSYGLQLWYVTAFTSGSSWNGLSDNWADHLQTQSVASSNRTGGCSGTGSEGLTFAGSAVRSRVQGHAGAGHDSLAFGFQSSDESSKNAYRRIAVGSVKLEVEYNRPAQLPTNLDTDGRGCATSAPGPWLTTQRPTLSGKPQDPDGRTGAHLQVHRIGSSGVYYAWKSATNRKHNMVVNHRIPHADQFPSGSYRWRMRSLDQHPQGTDSGWRQWCYFRVDVTAPTLPTVELVGDPPQAGEQVTLRFRSSDAHSGMDGFWYGVNEEVKRTFTSSSGTSTETFTALSSGGRNQVYVWSQDQAGNMSNRAVFDFFAARLVEATPAAAWRLDGDGLDDSGHGHELLLGSGVAWAADGGPPADRSMGIEGTGCVATAGPVVRTDAEYTVAAWVRLDDASADRMIMSPAGQVKPGFFFRYSVGSGKWRFTLHNADVREEASSAWFDSAQPAVLGQWTHLAVRVDPAAAHMQMYVNGTLSNERGISFAPWNAAGPLHVGCAANQFGETWWHFAGAVHHVGVWQGLLTPVEIQVAYQGGLAAGLTGDWSLRGDGADASAHARDLTIPALGDVQWVEDQYGRTGSAMRLAGTGRAHASGPVVRTDRSFSVAAWVRLDDKDGAYAVAAQAGLHQSGFYLRYHQGGDRWELAVPSADVTSPTWSAAYAPAPPQAGRWYHLVGVYDRPAGQLRLYVDGQLEGTGAGPATPWQAPGQLLVGASGSASGTWDLMAGSISDVKTWRGALTDGQVAQVYGGNPGVQALSRWNLDGAGTDLVGGHQLTLAGIEGVDYDWVEDQHCRPFRALGLHVSGQAYAVSGGPVVTTDASFTVATWVRLDTLTGDYQTVLAQGTNRAAFYLQATPTNAWRMSMPEQESGATAWAGAESAPGTVQAGVWTHLAAAFDLANRQIRLYVDGQLAGTGGAVAAPWHASGPFHIGAAGTPEGTIYQPVHGAIDSVMTWSSTLDPDRVADLGAPGLGFPCF